MHGMQATAQSTAMVRTTQLESLPAEWLRLTVQGVPVGCLSPHRAALAARWLPGAALRSDELCWAGESPGEAMAALALLLRERGEISGWRNEAYACERPVSDPCAGFGSELFRLERAAFRFFGLMSRAVHVNAWLPDGRMVCGRRALHKATDPGRLDNCAAGGLAAGESLLDCARRELWEEAGVPAALSLGLRPTGALRSRRIEPEGLHDEVLHVFSLELPPGFEPGNRDGEVSEFLCLLPDELSERLDAGEFSPDAEAVIRQFGRKG
jgi:8-oxo-dGTP pyrophosphatase MutT (NUDIX family)